MTLIVDVSAMTLRERAESVAAVAAAHAADVDARARFPHEAVDAMRRAGLLGCSVTHEYGGEGLGLVDLAAIASTIGAACSSTGMIFAMHHSQVLSLTRHAAGNSALADLISGIVTEQLLVASATTEIGIGGDVRTSTCFVQRDGDEVNLVKHAPVISYGDHADLILVTARRSELSAPDDQVVLIVDRDSVTLEPRGDWDTLGMRGTESLGYLLTASTSADRVLPEAYDAVLSASMGPACHTLWAAVWLGMSRAATETARQFVRAAARRSIGTVPPSAAHLVNLVAELERFEQLVAGAAAEFDRIRDDREALGRIGYVVSVSNLKITASALVADIVARALSITGISGFRNDGTFSVARLFRDAQGAAVMVSNDRILAHAAQLITVQKGH